MEADKADAGWEDEQISNQGLFISLSLAEGMCWVMGITHRRSKFGIWEAHHSKW